MTHPRNRLAVFIGGSVVAIAIATLGLAAPAQAPRSVRIPGGTFEASGVVAIPGTSSVLFVDDNRTREIFWLDFAASGRPRAAVSIPLGADVTDLEGITTDGDRFYVVGSQSKLTGTAGDGLVRFTFDPATRRIEQRETIRGLKAFLARNVAELRGTETALGDHVLNIESIAWDPAGRRLLLGLRAPLANGQALVVPLVLRDPAGAFDAANLTVPGGRAIPLALGGAGIRSLEFDPETNSFLVLTGAPLNNERLAFRLLEWSGPGATGTQSLREVTAFSRGLKPEGIAAFRLGDRDRRIIVYDGSTYLLVDQKN